MRRTWPEDESQRLMVPSADMEMAASERGVHLRPQMASEWAGGRRRKEGLESRYGYRVCVAYVLGSQKRAGRRDSAMTTSS